MADIKHINPINKYREVIRQKFASNDSTFLPTPNQRNCRMLDETNRYARLIKHFLKKVKAIAKATDDLISEVDFVIASPVPRQFTIRNGLLQQLDLQGQLSTPANDKLKTEKSGEAERKVSALRAELKREVFDPLNQWLVDQAEAKSVYQEAEGLRFELDYSRRRYLQLDNQLHAEEARGAVKDPTKTKRAAMDAQVKSLAHAFETADNKANKLLHELIDRAATLKAAVKSALEIESEALSKMASPSGFVEQSFTSAAMFEEKGAAKPAAYPAVAPAQPTV